MIHPVEGQENDVEEGPYTGGHNRPTKNREGPDDRHFCSDRGLVPPSIDRLLRDLIFEGVFRKGYPEFVSRFVPLVHLFQKLENLCDLRVLLPNFFDRHLPWFRSKV